MYAIDLIDNPNLDISPITETYSAAKPSKDDEMAHFHVGPEDIEKLVLKLQKYSRNKAVNVNVRQVVKDAVIEDAIDQTPTFTITVYDPDWELLASGALDGAVDINPGDIPHRWYRLDALDVNDDDLTLTFATRNAVFLSMHKAPVKFSRGKMTRAQAIKALLKRVKIVTIPMYCPQLDKKQEQAKFTGSSDRRKNDKRKQGFTPSDKLTVKAATATQPQRKVMSKIIEAGIDGQYPGLLVVAAVMCATQETTMGAHPDTYNKGAKYYGVFQQDTSPGSPWPATGDAYKDAIGFYNAAVPVYEQYKDTMTLGWIVAKVQGVLGSTNPLNNGYAQETDRWRGEAQHAVNAYGGIDVDDPGSPQSITDDYRKAYEFMVGEPDGQKNENYLGAIYRWASQVNWRAYWVRDVLHYMSEEDLFKSRARIRLRRYQNGIESVSMNRDSSKKVSQITLRVRMDRWVCPVGTVVIWDEGSPKTGKGRWLVTNVRRSVFDSLGEIILKKPLPEKKEPAPGSGTRTMSETPGVGGEFQNYQDLVEAASDDGAKGIVDQLLAIAQNAGGDKVFCTSDYRPNSVTTSGNPSDHGGNDAVKAARDIACRGYDALVGPPQPELDEAVVAIGRALGRPYAARTTIIDTFNKEFSGAVYRIQIIWRTEEYGGHMGHIHAGARRVSTVPTGKAPQE